MVLLFLLADNLNTGWTPGGRLAWLVTPLAGLAAIPFYRACTAYALRRRTSDGSRREKLTAALFAGLALLSFAWMLRDFAHFLLACSEPALDPGGIVALTALTCLYLASLRGHGLWRTAEFFFVPILLALGLSFAGSLSDCDFGRLLPLLPTEGAVVQTLTGTAQAFLRPFGQGFMAIAALCADAEPGGLEKGSRWAAPAAGVIFGLHYAKTVALVGWELAGRYAFPVYALAGLRRMGGGMHIEDLLICALLAARLIKGAVLLRFAGRCVGRMGKSG